MMHFKVIAEIPNPSPYAERNIEFTFDQPITAVVQIGKPQSESGILGKIGEKPVCIATTVGEIPADTDARLRSAISQAGPDKQINFAGISNDKRRELLAAVDAFFVPLKQLLESLVRVLRWRAGDATAALYPFLKIEEYLSTDGASWIQVPTLRGFQISQGIGLIELAVTPDLNEEIKALVAKNFEEPLGHQLFREAWNLRMTNARSALVIGVAAAEIGVKKLIGTVVPDARWLIEEIQSPPLGRLLRKYLPTLPMKAKFFGSITGFPIALIKTLESGVEKRNKTVHAGEPPPEPNELETLLRAVNDILWICDCYMGNTWAAAYISPVTIQAWTQEQIK